MLVMPTVLGGIMREKRKEQRPTCKHHSEIEGQIVLRN